MSPSIEFPQAKLKLNSQESEITTLKSRLESLEARLRIFDEKAAITEVLNEYARVLDIASSSGKLEDWEKWANVHSKNCLFAHPKSTCRGRENIAKCGMDTLEGIQGTQHISGNFQIEILGETEAKARTNVIACHVFDKSNRHEHLDEGGWYDWEFIKEEGEWKILTNKLTVTWLLGNGDAI